MCLNLFHHSNICAYVVAAGVVVAAVFVVVAAAVIEITLKNANP